MKRKRQSGFGAKKKGSFLTGRWGRKNPIQRILFSFEQTRWQNMWKFLEVLTLAEFQMQSVKHCVLKLVLFLRSTGQPYASNFLKLIHPPHSRLNYFCPLQKVSPFKSAEHFTRFSSFFNILISMMDIEKWFLKFNYFDQNNVCLVRNSARRKACLENQNSYASLLPSLMATPTEGKE